MSNRRPVSGALRRARLTARRGMTLLEVVLAVLILALVAAAVSSTMSYTLGQQAYNELRMGAHEIANRLVIQYLDDETVFRSMRGLPLDYGDRRFSWDSGVERVQMRVKERDSRSSATPQRLDRFELVTVRVWLDRSDQGPGAAQAAGGEPLATLTRLLDPMAPRNPDAMVRLTSDLNRILERTGMNAGPTSNQGPAGAGSRTGPGGGRGSRP